MMLQQAAFLFAAMALTCHPIEAFIENDDGTIDCGNSYVRYECCTEPSCGGCDTNICAYDATTCEDLGYQSAWLELSKTCGDLHPVHEDSSGLSHFKTWSGEFYDLAAACDLTLLHAPHFGADMALDINIRTKIGPSAIYTESAVVKIGEGSLEVQSFGKSFLNGIAGVPFPQSISGFAITYDRPNKDLHKFTIHLYNNESIGLKVYKERVSVSINNADAFWYSASLGMMGEFGTGRLLARDGATVLEDPNQLAAEWQVKEDEPMLFQSIQGPQHPHQCQFPSTSAQQKRAHRLGGSGEAASTA